MMLKANEAKSHISVSIALLSDLVISNSFKESFKLNDFFKHYIQTLPDIDKFKSALVEAILKTSLEYMFKYEKEDSIVISISTFILNILNAITEKDQYFVLDKIHEILKKLAEHSNVLINRQMFVIFALKVDSMLLENPNLKSYEHFDQITNCIFHSFDHLEHDDIHYTLYQLLPTFGMKIPFTIEDLKTIFRTDPRYYHVAALFFVDLLKTDPDKINTISFILDTIADISSGKPSYFFGDHPLLHDENQAFSQYIRTPGILLNGCSEFIYIIRELLKEKDELTIDIITFILNYNSPDKSKQEQCKDKLQKYEKFTNEKLLFAVFSVLSNVVEVLKNHSLVKNALTNDYCYMSCYIPNTNKFYGWKLPITENSNQQMFDATYMPISLLPFTYDLFANYDSLIPYFKENIQSIQSSIPRECLSYYILNSLNGYSTNSEFLNRFMKEFSNIELKYFTFSSDLFNFRKVLKHHLLSHTDGFYTKMSHILHFSYHSPSDILNHSLYSIGDDKVSCKQGIHCFMTQTLPQNRPTLLEFNLETKGSYCRIGLINLSIEEGDGESLFVEYLNDRVNILSSSVYPTSYDSQNKFLIQYDPLVKLATLYNYNYRPIETIKT